MAENSLYPSFGVVTYVSEFGAHKMTVPTRQWIGPSPGHTYGSYIAHDTTTIVDAGDMWGDLIDDVAVFGAPDIEFSSVTIYNMATPTAPRIPVVQIPLTQVGTSVATTQRKATQSTWNFRTTTFGIFKLVVLDFPVGSGFEKTLAGSFGAPDLAVIGALTDLTKAWSGRDGDAPANCHSKTYTLNEKLRRDYGMG